MAKVAIKNKNITSFGGIYRATQIVSSQKRIRDLLLLVQQ